MRLILTQYSILNYRYYYGFGRIHSRSSLNLNNRIDNLMTHVVVPITTSYFDTSTLMCACLFGNHVTVLCDTTFLLALAITQVS